MISNVRKYERNACFYLWLYREGQSTPELIPLPSQTTLTLPISQKSYKTTLKNVKVYIQELLKSDETITKAELERATHIGSFERRKHDEEV